MSQGLKSYVGVRLRSFRERQGWSLRTLADRCGLSINAISRIERGDNSPTVSSLIRLATALSIPITDFFIEPTQRSAVLVKCGQGALVQADGFMAEQLGGGLSGQKMEPFLLTVGPYFDGSREAIQHPGDEFILCLTGEIEFCIEEQPYRLQSGDSLLFQAMLPHFWRNPTAAPATLLLVFQAAQDNLMARQRHNLT